MAKTTKADADARGNAYLPGQEPIVVKELIDAAKLELEAKAAFGEARNTLLVHQQDLKRVIDANREHFTATENGDLLVYEAAGVRIEVDIKEKVKTSEPKDE